MTNIERLAVTVDLLQLTYDRALEDQARSWGCDINDPGLALTRTVDGNYLFLDALVTLVQAQAVLAQAERELP